LQQIKDKNPPCNYDDVAADSVFLAGAAFLHYAQKITATPEASETAARFLAGGPPQLTHAPRTAFQFLQANLSSAE
jgi:hypothetical protein